MAEPAKRNATYDDLLTLPDDVRGEIIFGALYVSRGETPPHAISHFALGGELGATFQKGRTGPGGWRFMTHPELRAGSHVTLPDIAGWRQERMPTLPRTSYIQLAPDWICEVLSPATEGLDRGPKRRIYASVAHLTFGPHSRLSSKPNVRCKSYTRLIGLLVFLLAPTFALERAAKGSKCRSRNTSLGVGHLWYLHPVERYLEVLALRKQAWVHIETFDSEVEFRAPPFHAVAFRLADLWPIPPPPDQTAR